MIAHAEVEIELGVPPQAIDLTERREDESSLGIDKAVVGDTVEAHCVCCRGRETVPNVEEEFIPTQPELQPHPISEEELLLPVPTQRVFTYVNLRSRSEPAPSLLVKQADIGLVVARLHADSTLGQYTA